MCRLVLMHFVGDRHGSHISKIGRQDHLVTYGYLTMFTDNVKDIT